MRLKSRERVCCICGKVFKVPYPSTRRKTCSKDCKNSLAAAITKEQFTSEEHKEKHSRATQEAMSHIDMKTVVKKRRSYKGENHPSYGKPRTTEWREAISRGNAGKRKGLTWEEIYGTEGAELKRKQNSAHMVNTNSLLLTQRTSKLEHSFTKILLPLGFEQNKKAGPYVVDFINKDKKEIIEIHGDYWHCNPSNYAPDFYNKSINMTSKDKWDYDKRRKEFLENLGYKVHILWEAEIKGRDVSEVIKKIGSENSGSILTEDAIKAAIQDYQNKQKPKP